MPEKIQNNLHFIWVGTYLRPREAKTIADWAMANPKYKTHLWTQDSMLLLNLQRAVNAFREGYSPEGKEKVKMKDTVDGIDVTITTPHNAPFKLTVNRIEHVPPLADPTILQEELQQWKNYGAASDILRIQVLHHCGGIYLDCDMHSFGLPLPLNITAPHDFLAYDHKFGGGYNLYSCLMAGPKGHDRFKTLAENMEQTYRMEYIPVGTGITKVTPYCHERMKKVEDARSVIAELEPKLEPNPFSEGPHWPEYLSARKDLKTYLCDPTRHRGGGVNEEFYGKYDYDVMLEFAFQHITGYPIVMGASQTWCH